MDSLNKYLIFSIVIHIIAGLFTIKGSFVQVNKPELKTQDTIKVSLVREHKKKKFTAVQSDYKKQIIHKKNTTKNKKTLSSEKIKAKHRNNKKKSTKVVSAAPPIKNKISLKALKKQEIRSPGIKNKKIKDTDGNTSRLDDEPISLNTKDARYFDYFAQIKKKIANTWSYPEEAFISGLYGKLRLKFVIDRSGQVIEVKIAASSGHTILDSGAISAVKKGSPYGPIPKNITRQMLSVIATFNYFPTFDVIDQ